jgi:hypothetical protein
MVESGGGEEGRGSDPSPLPESAPHTTGDVDGYLVRVADAEMI